VWRLTAAIHFQVITFTLIAGYSPFYAAQDSTAMADAVVTGRWKFEAPEWTNISPDCKDFIKKLMLINPKNRMNAHDALQHVWLRTNCPPGYIEHLQKMNDHCIAMEYKQLGMEPPAPTPAPTAAATEAAPTAGAETEGVTAEGGAAKPQEDKTAYPTEGRPADTTEYSSLLATLDRYQAPKDAQDLLEVHALAAETKKSRWQRSIATKAVLLRSVDLLFQSVHIKHSLQDAVGRAPASPTTSAPIDHGLASDDEVEGAEPGPARIDKPESINRKIFKFAPSETAIAAYEKLMEEE